MSTGTTPLYPGKRLGPYEIVSPIGAGGMGEVYKGRDTRLDRTVAIKILPASVAADPDLRRRFEREGRAISQLTHPHICTLYDVGNHDGVEFLVMEHLDGETLAARLRRGKLPIEQALAIARDILEALDAAHSRGITHRDLKPANVMVTREGAKLLDFGLAKLRNPGGDVTRLLDVRMAREAETAVVDSDALTREHPITGARTILGTVEYMAPEQIEGREADARTDVFAFGVLLYEMITGRRAFEGSSQSALIGAILLTEPAPIRSLDASVPAGLDALVRRCMAKDPNDRWQNARDLRWHLDLVEEVGDGPPARTTRRVHALWAAGLVGGVLATGLAVANWPNPEIRAAVRAHLDVPDGGRLAPEYYPALAVSPDGTRVVFRGGAGETTMLMLRRVEGSDAQPIPGTENAHTPFFSPDGQWLGFIADKKVKKVAVSGGQVLLVCPAPSLSPGSPGAAWGPDDWIVFAAGIDGLMRVPAAGGTPEELTRRDDKRGEHTHHGPQFLPGGRDLLFTVKTGSGESHAAILSLETRAWTWIEGLDAISGAVKYLPTGHLVYPEAGATGRLRAVPFDLAIRQVVGTPVTLPDEVYTQASSDVVVAQFAASDRGVLSYITGRPPPWSLVRVGLDRKVTRLGAESRTFRYPRVSPDGSQIAVTIAEERSDIYLLSVARGILRSVTASGSNTQPIWMNGRDLVFSSTRPGAQGWDLYRIPADVGGDVTPELLLSRPGGQFPSGWSPVAPVLAFYELGNNTARDVWIWSRDTREPTRLLGTAASERAAVFSPDGAWLAYVSDELGGRDEVYIQRYPGPGGRERVSPDGGTEPLWSPRGSELYYRKGRTLYSVAIDRARGMPQGAPRIVFEEAFELAPADVGRANYDVFPDGSFVFIRSETRNTDWHVHVVLNWFDELRQSSPR